MKQKSLSKKLIASPYFVWAAIFIIVPLLFVVYYSLVDANGAFTLEYVSQIGKYKDIMLNSIWLGFIATVISLLLAYPLAFIMARSGLNVQRTMMMLVMLPMWMNLLIRTYSLMILLQDTGIINSVLSFLHLPKVHMINTQGAVVLGMIYNYIPYMILPLYSVLTKIDNSVIEAAQDLGANDRKVFLKVVFPMSMPGVISGITMVFVPAVSTFIISKMLGGGGNLLIGDLIDMQFLGSAYNPNLGSAISLVLMVIILICMGIMNQFDDGESVGGGMIL